MKKTLYIFSYFENDEKEYDWFIGKDSQDEQGEVIKYLKENYFEDKTKSEISEKIENIYKQDRGVMLRELLGI